MMTTDLRPVRTDWDSMINGVSEDRLLLLEQSHRVSNEAAAALAALHLIKNAPGSRGRWQLLEGAIARLEGFSAVNRLLTMADAAQVDLSVEMERLCMGLSAGRRASAGSRITLDLNRVDVDGVTARCVLMVAAELLQNAVKYALEGRTGTVVVVLRRDGSDVAFSVVDDGPGIGAAVPSGWGMGGPLVRELVRRAGGSIDCDTGPSGTTFYVLIPERRRKQQLS